MSNAQKGGHAQPLFTNVHAINSFLAFPFMGIVEQWDRDAVDREVYSSSPFPYSLSIFQGAL